MSDREKREQEIMNQEMSTDEMETIAGGVVGAWDHVDPEKRTSKKCTCGAWAQCSNDPSKKYGRPLYRPDGSVNCSATVEDGSWCGSDDACYSDETIYFGMLDCEKAWK